MQERLQRLLEKQIHQHKPPHQMSGLKQMLLHSPSRAHSFPLLWSSQYLLPSQRWLLPAQLDYFSCIGGGKVSIRTERGQVRVMKSWGNSWINIILKHCRFFIHSSTHAFLWFTSTFSYIFIYSNCCNFSVPLGSLCTNCLSKTWNSDYETPSTGNVKIIQAKNSSKTFICNLQEVPHMQLQIAYPYMMYQMSMCMQQLAVQNTCTNH